MTRPNRDYGAHHRENARAIAAKPAHMRPAPRLCLNCREPFISAHAGNRLCGVCRDKLQSEGAMALPS